MGLSNLQSVMKTTPVCRIFAALGLLVSAVLAQEERPAAGHKGMWDKVDQDGDGAISGAEFAQMPRVTKLPEEQRQHLFQHLDKNGDGRIDRAEIQTGKPGGSEGRPQLPGIGELDSNKDGAVTFEEMQAGRFFSRLDPEKQKHIFARLDSNGDGRITPEDKPPRRPRPEGEGRPRPDGGGHGEHMGDMPRPRGLIEHLDKNGDGVVTLEEFSANPRMSELDAETIRQRYRMLDRNRDGKVDRSDIQRGNGQPQRPKPDQGGPRIE